MPHDINGVQVEVGDIVNVPFEVVEVHATDEYCNASLKTVYPMYPGQDKMTAVLNTKQFAVEQDRGNQLRVKWAEDHLLKIGMGQAEGNAVALLAFLNANSRAYGVNQQP